MIEAAIAACNSSVGLFVQNPLRSALACALSAGRAWPSHSIKPDAVAMVLVTLAQMAADIPETLAQVPPGTTPLDALRGIEPRA